MAKQPGLTLPLSRKEQQDLKRKIRESRIEGFRPTAMVILYTIVESVPHFLLIKPSDHPGRWMPIQGGIESKRDGDNIGVTIHNEVPEEVGIALGPKGSHIEQIHPPFDLPFEHKTSGTNGFLGKRYFPAVVQAPQNIVYRRMQFERKKISGTQWAKSYEEAADEMRNNRPEKNTIILPIIADILGVAKRRSELRAVA